MTTSLKLVALKTLSIYFYKATGSCNHISKNIDYILCFYKVHRVSSSSNNYSIELPPDLELGALDFIEVFSRGIQEGRLEGS